ncbi:thioredoxin-like domain-containing protein [Myxococcaceae bacterium GXIMD 01537]
MSPWVVAVSLAMLLPACAAQRAGISGELRGSTGEVLSGAQVLLTLPGGNLGKPLASAPVGPEGRFELPVPGSGDYMLWLTAPGHVARSLYVPVSTEEENPTLQATVEPYSYRDPIEQPKVIGSWNQFSFALAEPMSRQPDGSWVLERAAEGQSVEYQLLNVTADARSVPGTQAEGYGVDGSGDYLCKVPVRDGRIRIVFEPGKLKRRSPQERVRTTFEAPHAYLGAVNALRAEARDAADQARLEFRDRRDMEPKPHDYGALPGKLLATARNPSEPLVARQYAVMLLLSLPFFEFATALPAEKGGEGFVKEVLALVPVDSTRWVLAPNAVPRLAALMPKAAREPILNDFARRCPDAGTRAGAIATLLNQAHLAGDTARVAALTEELKPYAADNMFARIILDQVRTDRKVDKGLPVPAFSAELLDGKGTASRELLAGRFYLVDFWAVWCEPCIAEMSALHAAWEKFRGRGGFTILSVSMDKRAENVQRFREGAWKLPWLNVHNGDDFTAPLPKAFEVTGLPTTVLVDGSGRIVATGLELRGARLEKTLEALLPPAPSS